MHMLWQAIVLIPLHDSNPLRVVAFQAVTFSIILLCTLVFLYQQVASEQQAAELIYAFGMLPAVLFEHRHLDAELAVLPAEFTLVTSIFLHSGWMHLIGNMAFLWVFGDNVEDSMGHLRFLVFFLICGLFASLAHALVDTESINPLVGASGAIAGVLGAYLMLHPRVKVIVLVGMRVPLRLRAYWVIGFWVALQVFFVATNTGGNTAWWAHIGGFITGVILIPFLKLPAIPLFDRSPK